jgi:hypothetical protein
VLTATLRFEGRKIWRDEILDKRFRIIDGEIGVGRIVRCMND